MSFVKDESSAFIRIAESEIFNSFECSTVGFMRGTEGCRKKISSVGFICNTSRA